MITGFACTFVAAKSTKIDFEGTEVLTVWDIQDQWMEDGILHMRAYKEADTFGTIDGIEYTGYNILNLHNKLDPVTGDVVANGKATMYIEWNGLVGTFYGPVNAKGNVYYGPFEGKYVLQGAGDFEGMTLFGIVWVIGGPVNGMSGTILIPN
jgi:hypothetical protein